MHSSRSAARWSSVIARSEARSFKNTSNEFRRATTAKQVPRPTPATRRLTPCSHHQASGGRGSPQQRVEHERATPEETEPRPTQANSKPHNASHEEMSRGPFGSRSGELEFKHSGEIKFKHSGEPEVRQSGQFGFKPAQSDPFREHYYANFNPPNGGPVRGLKRPKQASRRSPKEQKQGQ